MAMNLYLFILIQTMYVKSVMFSLGLIIIVSFV